MKKITRYSLLVTRYKNILFYCTTLLYFLFIGGFFRSWLPQAAPETRFAVALSVLAFLGLVYWFFERILDQGLAGTLTQKILLFYWITFWFFLFFVSRPWLTLFFTISWLLILWWQVNTTTNYQRPTTSFKFNILVALTVSLLTIDLYSFATFFNFPVLILAIWGGILFASVWLFAPKDPGISEQAPSLSALLATVFLGVETIWLSRFFPWSIAAMTAFFLGLLAWLATTRFLGRWSWFASGSFLVFMAFLLLGLRWS